MSITREARELQREYNRVASQLVEAISRPRPRLTRWERVLCYIALEWPEPFAALAGKAYMRRRARLTREGKTL